MILVDTSIWIDHLHYSEPHLADLLGESRVATHPLVVGELALGQLRDRTMVLTLLDALPAVAAASHEEVRELVDTRALFGRGLSLVDAHLLASTVITPGATLWTRDKRLHAVAVGLGVDHRSP